jgi:rubrerythrin
MMRRQTNRIEINDSKHTVVWTHCAKCGDTWVTKAVLRPGKCPVCGSKPKSQKRVF